MLIIRNCNLINMADILEQPKDLIVDNGKVKEIADCGKFPDYENATVIDAGGSYVLPGFVEPHCQVGVKEQIYRFEGNDADEVSGPILPQLRAIDAINPADEGFAMALRGGVTTVVTGPGDTNLIGGTFAAIKTHGETFSDMIISDEIAFKMVLGNEPKNAYGSKGNMPKTRMASAGLIREALFKAREYYNNHKTGQTQKFDIKMDSLMRVFDGMLVKIQANQANDIMAAVSLAEEFGLNYTIDQCSDAHLIIPQLKKHNIRCVLGPLYGSIHSYEYKNRNAAAAGILEQNQIPFAVSTGHPKMNLELAAVHLAFLRKNGMTRKAALEAATLNAARFVGLENRIGSLEVGKDADIVIWDSDPLDYYSSPSHVFVNGKIVF